jgi:outer membrane receptor protein involved in Fe transport
MFAQPSQFSFTVKGRILENETNTPMEYVNVVVYNSKDSSFVAGAMAQNNGDFSIKVNHPGDFYLIANFVGFEKSTVSNIVLKPGNDLYDVGDLIIKPKSLGIGQVLVIGDKPFVSYKIDRKVIDVSQNPSAQGGTAVDALQNVPSVQTDIEGNITLRGSSQFTVLIDGRQSPLTGTDALNQIPADAIDKIEIITNPSVKYDPDGTAGIINIVTKKGKIKGHSFVFNTSVGSSPLYSTDMTYSYRMKKTIVTTSFGYRYFKSNNYNFEEDKIFNRDTITAELDSTTMLRKNMNGEFGNKSYSFKIGVDYDLSDHNTLTIGGSRQEVSFTRNADSRINNFYTKPYQTFLLTKTGLENNPKIWQFNIGDRQIFQGNSDHFLSLDFQYQQSESNQYDLLSSYNSNINWDKLEQSDTLQKSRTRSSGTSLRTEINYQKPFANLFTFETGYTLRVEKENTDYILSEKEADSSQWLQNSLYDDHADFSSYIHAAWALIRGDFRGLQYSMGIRAETTDRLTTTVKDNYNFKYNKLGWYPSFALTKEWKGGNTLQINYSKRINRPRNNQLSPFPALSDGYSLYLPNPKLKPEHAESYELNYQRSWGKSFISLETFYRNTKDNIERMSRLENDSLNVHTMINQGIDIRIGSEMNANLVLSKWFTIIPKFTMYYYKAEGTYDSVLITKENYTWEGGLTGNFSLPTKTRLQIMGQYRAPEEELDGDSKSMYWLSASVMQGFFDQKLTLSFRVDDIFQTRKSVETNKTFNSEVYSKRYRESPTFVFSLAYRFNQNGDKKRNGKSNEDPNGGMDMEF